MQKNPSQEPIMKSRSANSSPRLPHKSSTMLFGLLTKRSTKVEPHPVVTVDGELPTIGTPSTAQATAAASASMAGLNLSRPSSACDHYGSSRSGEHDVTFAKCTPNDQHRPPSNVAANHANYSLISSLQRKSKASKGRTHKHRHSAEAAHSDSGGVEGGGGGGGGEGEGMAVVFRQSPKHRSSNHNRFSHQFSLCCKAEKKPVTPPVTVRYNSIPDSAAAAVHLLRRDNLSSLSWSMADNVSLSTECGGSGGSGSGGGGGGSTSATNAQPASADTSTLLAPLASCNITECSSAPQSPVTTKSFHFAPAPNPHHSPTNSSLQMNRSYAANDVADGGEAWGGGAASGSGGGGGGSSSIDGGSSSGKSSTAAVTGSTATATTTPGLVTTNGPVRPIAVSACRSRLRLKLYPPGKALAVSETQSSALPSVGETLKRATTPQHMSSPNIATQPDLGLAFASDDRDDAYGMRFMSHENIQMGRQSSSSGLARHTLMAAQVLSLIPTENARERSFLDGRLGSSTLLGPSELSRVLPSKEVTIFVGTWNMNGQSPPKQMNDFVLPATVEHVPDIVAIGTQESSPDRFEWEVTIQETLGPTHVLFHSTTLGTLHLAVFMRRDLIWYCSAPEDASMSVRTGSAFRTKGAVAISFCLFGTSMLFVTSHLTAHQQKVKERVSDVKRIIHALDLPRNLKLRHKSKDVTQNFDNVFWCGDLNFRLGEPREKLLEWIQNTKFPLPSHLPHGYMHTDQLSSVLADGAAFRGFMEANITFPPTYKYDPGTQHFDTSSKQRAPAYTDRILYKYRQQQGLIIRRQSTVPNVSTPTQPYIQCLLYDSVPSITTSDHKPVWALFKTLIRAGTDSIPLAAGLFSRDIYLEGMKRRLNNQYSDSSAVCAIQ